MERQTIPGAVALVARHGKVATLEAEGWRDVEGRKPMATDSIFQVMSMTKNFTGAAIMMLVEEGKIELRRPVSDYLPEFAHQLTVESRPPAHAPTVAQLMSHTSGLGGDPEGELSDNPRTLRVPLADAVRSYGKQPLQFEPGTRWRYSNMGIAALGHHQKCLGEEYAFHRARSAQPLGMKDSFFLRPIRRRMDRTGVQAHGREAGALGR